MTEEANGERRTANGEDSSSNSLLTTRHSPEDANGEQRIASCEDGYDSSSHSPLATHHSLEAFFSSTPFAIRYSLLACEALLRITVCDPSCGSGHFLLAAARRLAETLAELRAPDGAVRPDDYRHTLREVASRCLYGVDINPMAVELCRVALWLETVDPGKPLGFLNHHIRHGNSLLGTTPDLIAAGLPDETFTAIEGDDKPACAELKKRNKAERTGFGPLFVKEEDSIREKLRQADTSIEAMDDSQPAALQKKEAAFLTNETAPETRHAKLLADLWCAAFVIKKHFASRSVGVSPTSSSSESPISNSQSLFPDDDLFGQPVPASKPTAKPKSSSSSSFGIRHSAFGITTGTLRDFVQGKPLPEDLKSEVTQLAEQYRFFHWHLAFPQVFAQGGFDCILGNPPWERVKLLEKEWFSKRRPEIANASNAGSRRRLIAALRHSEPNLFLQFENAVRKSEGESQLLRSTGLYPLCGRGDINLYAVFAERVRILLTTKGLMGIVLPSGIATDDTTKLFFQDTVEKKSLVSLFSFENEEFVFPAVHHSAKFCLFTCGSPLGQAAESAEFIFFARQVEHLRDPDRRFSLSVAEVNLLSPNTHTCPIFRSRRDTELAIQIRKRTPAWKLTSSEDTSWGVSIRRVIDLNLQADLLKTSDDFVAISGHKVHGNFLVGDEPYLRLYEGKMMTTFNHRFADAYTIAVGQRSGRADAIELAELVDADRLAGCRSWVSEAEVKRGLAAWRRRWLLAYMDVCSATNERTVIPAIIPWSAPSFSLRVLADTTAGPAEIAALQGCLASFVFDYYVRQFVGGLHLSDYIMFQMAVLPPATYAQPCPWALHPQSTIHDPPSLRDWLLPRVLELTYTAWDLEAFAADCLAEADGEQRMASGEDISSHSPLTTHHSPEDANSEQRMANGKDVGDSSTSSLSPFATPHSPEGFAGYWRRYSPHSPFAIHHSPPPFRWDEDRRFLLRCELDAAFFHLYLGASREWGMASGKDDHSPLTTRHSPEEANSEQRMANGEDISSHSPLATHHSPEDANSEQRMASGKDVDVSSSSSHSPLATHHSPLLTAFPTPRHAVSYIMDTFPIVKRKDEAKHNGTYRTKETILQIYDALAESIATGSPYQTLLDPPPADPACCHPPRPLIPTSH